MSDGQPVAVILVVNKSEKEYLPGVFSMTDQTLMENIAKIPLRASSRRKPITPSKRFQIWLFNLPMDGEQQAAAERKRLLETVRRFVPGIEAGAISLRSRREEAPTEGFWELGEITEGSAEVLRNRMELPLANSRDALAPLEQNSDGSALFVYERELQVVDRDRIAVLHIATRRPGMAQFEKKVLNSLATDLGQLIRSERSVRQRVGDLIQIRHALRSGLSVAFDTSKRRVSFISSWNEAE